MTNDVLQIGNAYWDADHIARISFIKAKQLAKNSRCQSLAMHNTSRQAMNELSC